jgi:hypothetical protein
MPDLCPQCGLNRDLVGYRHRCIPKQAILSPVRHAVKKGRPRIGEEQVTLEAEKPWLKLGLSRRTWYRRQAEKQ